MVEVWSAEQMPIDINRIRQIEDELDRSTTTGERDKDDTSKTEPKEEGPEQ
jgi:hypothetical protein